MELILKQYDIPLLRFSATNDSSTPEIEVHWINEDQRHLLPLDMELSPEGISRWMRRRTIPRNRAYVNRLLAKCGLNANRPMGILALCKGLSVDDSYWVVEEGFEGTFEKYNLFENRFSEVLALIAFTGYGSSNRSSLASSPEFTTNGMLPKCWRRISGKVTLYKGGTDGGYNTGAEPYCEYYAAQVAAAMGIDAIPYGLSQWKGRLCSTCELFTDIDHAYMPIGNLVQRGGFDAVAAYYENLGEPFQKAFRDMLVFDAVICNTDRHYGNFGFMIDNKTNTIAAPAPLFDHGNSLFNQAGPEDYESTEAFQQYIDTLVPCVYDDFFATAKRFMTDENREQLRKLLGFRFKRHVRYNLPPKRLKLMEEQVRKRAMRLLENKEYAQD